MKQVKPANVRPPSPTAESSGDHSNHASASHVTSDNSIELTLSLDKVQMSDNDTGKTPVIRFSKASISEEEVEGVEVVVDKEVGVANGGDVEVQRSEQTGDSSKVEEVTTDEILNQANGGPDHLNHGSVVTGEGEPPSSMITSELTDKERESPCNEITSGTTDKEGGAPTNQPLSEPESDTPFMPETNSENQVNENNSTDDPLSKMGVIDPSIERSNSGSSGSSTKSCAACENIRSNEPVFLHIHVRPKPGMTYTYTPINNSVGIDIPRNNKNKKSRSSRSPSFVQQVKTCFCFAFPEKM